MAIKPRELLDRAKQAPRTLKIIAVIAAIDVVVLALAALTLEDQVDERITTIEQRKSELAGIRARVEATRKEIANLPELRQRYDAAMADGVLSDQDRQKMIANAQQLQERHRLLDLHYRLEPQITTPGSSPAFTLVTTPVSFSQTAVIDSDIFEFWEELLGNLQSHYQITKATIDRADMSTQNALASIRNNHPVAMVKSELAFRWVSMRKVASTTTAPAAGAGNAAAAPARQPVKAAATAQQASTEQ